MDFTLDDTQREISALAAGVLSREIDHDRPAGPRGFDEQVWTALGKAGLLGLPLAPELGGDGLGVAEVAVVLRELGRSAAPVPSLSLAFGALPLDLLGTPDQRAAFLPDFATGEAVLTAAVHEPSAILTGEPKTQAFAEGGRWVLTGVKTHVPYAGAATRVLVPSATPTGVAVFLVDPSADGVTVEGTTMRLERVTVAEADQLPDGEGGALATLLRFATAGMVALGDGVLAGALELTTKHVGQREQFGRPLAAFQAVAQQIADVYIASRTVHLAALSAIWRLAAGLDPQPDLGIAAYWFAEEAPRALATCHHLHGGLGVDVTYPLHRYYALTKELSACTSN